MSSHLYPKECLKISRVKLFLLSLMCLFPFTVFTNEYVGFIYIMVIINVAERVKNIKCPSCDALVYEKSRVGENIFNVKCNSCGFDSDS